MLGLAAGELTDMKTSVLQLTAGHVTAEAHSVR
jgi:hypothetical protein